MPYPPEFVARVREEYAGDKDVLKSVERGEYTLGKRLIEGSEMRMSPDEIVQAFRAGHEDQILAEAEAAIRRRRLHADWIRLMLRTLESGAESRR
jgi:hypothetical protein